MVVGFQEFDKTSFPLVIYTPNRVPCFDIAIILSYTLVFIVSDYGIYMCHMPRYMTAANETKLKQTHNTHTHTHP
jgi:hypothetical protein